MAGFRMLAGWTDQIAIATQRVGAPLSFRGPTDRCFASVVIVLLTRNDGTLAPEFNRMVKLLLRSGNKLERTCLRP
jgi:hypothetical protein